MFKNHTIALLGAATLLPAGTTIAQESSAPPVVGNVMVGGSPYAEDRPDGENGEPSWVRNRRFSTTRIYVQQDPGEVGIEQWYRVRDFEYAFCHEGADGIEPKLLIGDDFGAGWHWGLIFIHERRVWGDAEAEWGIAGGISKTIVDSCFSIGIEGKWTHPEGGSNEGIVGPTIQWLPNACTHVDLLAMAGVNDS